MIYDGYLNMFVGVVFGLLDRPLCTGLEETSFPGQGGWTLAYRLQAANIS
jgi:hypothetical protein